MRILAFPRSACYRYASCWTDSSWASDCLATTISSVFIYHSLSAIQPPKKRKAHIIFLYGYAAVVSFIGVLYLVQSIETSFFDVRLASHIIMIISFYIAIVTALSATIALIAIRIKRGRANVTSL